MLLNILKLIKQHDCILTKMDKIPNNDTKYISRCVTLEQRFCSWENHKLHRNLKDILISILKPILLSSHNHVPQNPPKSAARNCLKSIHLNICSLFILNVKA